MNKQEINSREQYLRDLNEKLKIIRRCLVLNKAQGKFKFINAREIYIEYPSLYSSLTTCNLKICINGGNIDIMEDMSNEYGYWEQKFQIYCKLKISMENNIFSDKFLKYIESYERFYNNRIVKPEYKLFAGNN